jgi:hypothetical protein
MATASITEVDNQGRPFDSSASIMIQNVIPRDNGGINKDILLIGILI